MIRLEMIGLEIVVNQLDINIILLKRVKLQVLFNCSIFEFKIKLNK